MFEIFNQLRSELTGTPLQSTPASIEERKQVVEEVVNRLYKSAVPQGDKVTVDYDKSIDHTKFCVPKPNQMHVPLLSLIDSAEIPPEFRVTDIDDPRLKEKQFIKKYSEWVYDKLAMPRGEKLSDEVGLKGNKLLFENRSLAKDAIKFALLHELGHVYHDDMGKMTQMLPIIQNIISCLIPIGATIGLCSVLPGLLLVVVIPVSIPFIFVASCVNRIFIGLLIRRFYVLPFEKRADDFAVKHGPDTLDGFIHMCKVWQQINKMSYESAKEDYDLVLKALEPAKDTCFGRCLINAVTWLIENSPLKFGENEYSLTKSHPLIKERIAHLESMQQRNSPPLLQVVRA